MERILGEIGFDDAALQFEPVAAPLDYREFEIPAEIQVANQFLNPQPDRQWDTVATVADALHQTFATAEVDRSVTRSGEAYS